MARKDLLKGLLSSGNEAPSAPQTPSAAPAPTSSAAQSFNPMNAPRMNRGAIGAVGQSIADLRSRSVFEVSADLIDAAGLEDRLDKDAEGIEALAASMRIYGQQVPVLLRHSPKAEGRYEIVYGRRRVAALREAGLPVKAMLRDLTDRDLMIAQGQENALRKDLSFIEKANFARQMRDAEFERAVICDALAIDKTVVSRMLTVIDTIPLPLLHAIGAAPSIGRDRWLELSARIQGRDTAALRALISGASSDDRFETLFRALSPRKADRSTPSPLMGSDRLPLGLVTQRGGKTILTFSSKEAEGFDEWLVTNIETLHQQFLSLSDPEADSTTGGTSAQ